jgi:flagellar biosynthesis protein FliR
LTSFAADFGLDAQVRLGPHVVLGTFILFCRIGACLMLMPGFSSPQIPVQMRLFLALAVTLSMTPLLLSHVPPEAIGEEPLAALQFIATELLVGAVIGALGRLFLLALETMAMAGAMAISLSNPFGVVAEEASEVLPPFVSLVTMSATALIFIADLHWEVFRGLAASYDALPIKGTFDANFSLLQFSKMLAQTFEIALRISAPFIIYSVIIQIAVSIINRVTPHVSIYFISTPFVIVGGLFLTYLTIKSYLDQFVLGLSAWLSAG